MSSKTSQLPRWRSLTPEERQSHDALRQLLRQVAVATQGGMPVAEAVAAHVPRRSAPVGPMLTRDLTSLPGLWHLLRRPGRGAARVRHLMSVGLALMAAGFIIALAVLLLMALLNFVPAPYGLVASVAVGIPAMAWLFVCSLAPARVGDTLRLSDDLMSAHAVRLSASMQGGHSLAQAVGRCFPQAPAGVQHAARLLDRGDHAEARLMLRTLGEPLSKLRRGLAPPYLSWLVAILGSISLFILVSVMPKFQEIFSQLGAELPQLTHHVINASHPTPFVTFLVLYGLLLFFRHQSLERCLLYGFLLSFPFMRIFYESGVMWVNLVFALLLGDEPSHWVSAEMSLLNAWATLALLIAASKTRVVGLLDITPLAGLLPPVRRLRQMRAQSRFLGMLATHDSERLSLAELGEAVATLEPWRRGPLEKFAKALHAGADLPAVLQSPGMHPLDARQARQLALAARVGHVRPAAESLLNDLEAERHRAAHQLRSLVQFGLLLTLAAVTALVVIALYLPIFYIPAIVQPLG